MLTQFFLGQEIQGQGHGDERGSTRQIAELTELLQLERAQFRRPDLATRDPARRRSPTADARTRPGQRSSPASARAWRSARTPRSPASATDLANPKSSPTRPMRRWRCSTSSWRPSGRRSARSKQALEASETHATPRARTQIADLGRRLNLALAQRVQDLSRYRSDFFGRLRADPRRPRRRARRRRPLRVPVRSAVRAPARPRSRTQAAARLASSADAIKQLETEIPADVNWVLRIDGHTDKPPDQHPRVPSNWELLGGARDLGGQVSRRRRASPPGTSSARRLRRIRPDRYRRHRRGLRPQPPHRVR